MQKRKQIGFGFDRTGLGRRPYPVRSIVLPKISCPPNLSSKNSITGKRPWVDSACVGANILSLDGVIVHEILLGDEFLMSSLFTVVEEALADLGLAAAVESTRASKLDVVVGGLGLGYTARAALKNPAVESLIVVDYLESVIEWHQQGLVPLGPELTADPRCRFVHGDFFKLALGTEGGKQFDPEKPERRFHAVLLDIDHSPSKLLHETHGDFYQADGLRQLTSCIHPGGIFALWSDDPPG